MLVKSSILHVPVTTSILHVPVTTSILLVASEDRRPARTCESSVLLALVKTNVLLA